MHLELMRIKDKEWPSIEEPLQYSSAKVWYCKFRSLAPISQFKNLKTLVIAGFPDSTLDPISSIVGLEYLQIVHMPKITSLDGLSGLKNLQSLSLSTLPSWDSSGKRTIVDSLHPIAALKKLKYMELYGICPANSTLVDLEDCASLVSASFSKYPTGVADQFIEKMGLIKKGVQYPVPT